MFVSPHNLESSALPYLTSANGGESPLGSLEIQSPAEMVDVVASYLNDHSALDHLQVFQSRLLSSLEGSSHLFAKDYLNYFLDLNLSVNP